MSDYFGDIRLGDSIDIKFTTRQISGGPTTLAGSPVVSAYPSNSTTELTAGITLTVDFDSRAGYNNVRVVATSGNGYATATNYDLCITTGTVNSVSVVGESIGSFSIENRSALMPATAGRTLVVDANGLADANVVKIGPTGSGAAQTARDIGASVLVSAGSGTGQLDFTSGVIKANVTQLLGTAWLTPGTAGTPDVNVKLWNALATVALPLVPTVAGRTLDCSAGGEAGIDWANIGSPATAQNLSGTLIQAVNNLAAGSDSINTTATSGSTLTTGSTVSGTYASTGPLDGTYWQIADAAGTLDMYFEFNVGATGVPTTAVWTGGLTTAVNSLKVFAYNWAGTAWDQVGALSGTTSLVVNNAQYDFTTAHVGTGGNLGLVRLRFQNTGLTGANFYTDQVLCGYTNVQTFPTNFSSFSLDASGRVDVIKVAGTTQTAGDLKASITAIPTSVWQDATAGDFTVASSIGKALYIANIAPGGSGGHFISGSNAGTTIVGALTSTGAFTINGVSDVAQTGDSFARLGAPTGASIAADIQEIEAETDTLLAGVIVTTNNDKAGYSLAVTPPTSAQIQSAVWTTQLTEAYAALHGVPTAAQALFEIRALLAENSVVGTTVTVKKIDGATTAHTYTIDSATVPTSITTAS